MRNPSRIYPLLYKIGDIWVKKPDLRLGQLLENILAATDKSLFYVEDKDFEKLIDRFKR